MALDDRTALGGRTEPVGAGVELSRRSGISAVAPLLKGKLVREFEEAVVDRARSPEDDMAEN